ncbi:hypothetical protein EV586_1024 [Tumebacillus sp. BK434]|nr:hypothetical protein [Tumebacillus sp. BK434]TCP57563.1 hypothetical protein EV586_1024 [Tumebacillus sp. BK434]
MDKKQEEDVFKQLIERFEATKSDYFEHLISENKKKLEGADQTEDE